MKSYAIFTSFVLLMSLLDYNRSDTSPVGLNRSPSSISFTAERQLQDPEEKRIIELVEKIGIRPNVYRESESVIVAIVDTGINLKDEWLMSKVYRKNGVPQIFDLSGVTTDGSDNHGHGTQMASIILSINPNVRIIPIKFLDYSRNVRTKIFNKALSLANSIPEVSIINISGGGGEMDVMERINVAKMVMNGKLVISASGNYGEDIKKTPFYPASYDFGDSMISVANLLENGNLNPSSNYGQDCVDFAVLGTDVPSYDYDGRLFKGTGTSQATAITTGIVSLMKGLRPQITNSQIKSILKESSVKRANIRHGEINASMAIIKTRLKTLKSESPAITAIKNLDSITMRATYE